MFNFSMDTPFVMLLGCPACICQQQERTTLRIVYQQRCLCPTHRAHLEMLLRDPKAPKLAIQLWLNLWRKEPQPV